MKAAAIVLCGGQSTRMGRSKAWLPFGPERMLQRVVRIVAEATEPVIVVAAEGQDLPPLPAPVRIVRDRRPERGPLEGLAAGMAPLTGVVDAAYVTSCDVPLLHSDFVRQVVAALEDHEIAVPWVDGFYHPLAAAYRLTIAPVITRLLQEDRLRITDLFQTCRTRTLGRLDLQLADAACESLVNLNHPDDYRHALRRCGFEEE